MPAGYAAGFMKGLIWIVGTSGYAYGQSSAPANNTVNPAYVLNRPKTANLAYVEPTEVDVQAADKTLYSFFFGNTKIGKFDLILADVDPALLSLITGQADNSTYNTSFEIFGVNPNLTVPKTLGLALIQRFQPVIVGSPGPDQYHNLIFPRCYIRPKFGPFAYQADAPMTFEVVTAFSNVDPHGTAFSASGMTLTTEGDLVDHYGMITANPIMISTFIADGSTTTFTVSPKPQSSVVTSGAAPNWFAKNGTITALASVVPATGVCTLASAGSAADADVLMYQVLPTYPP